MSIQQFTASHFRNLSQVDLELSTGFNILCGPNGSGKTSFLEAIFFLSSGKSFRARSVESMIQKDFPHFSVFAKIANEGRLSVAGAQRFKNGEKKIRLDGENQRTHLEMAKLLPVLLVNTDEHQLVVAGPEHRRRFMNWGMFHVERDFYRLWQRAQYAVKQRNCVLKSGGQPLDLIPWTQELLSVADVLDEMRRVYIEQLTVFFDKLTAILLSEISNIQMIYQRGWKQDESLAVVLDKAKVRDELLGYTQYGPHRADLIFKVGPAFAKDVLSRGQQKLMVYALRLAQGLLFYSRREKNCIYLVDDLTAELDRGKREKVVGVLKDMEAQVFITGVEKDELLAISSIQSAHLFHVEQGRLVW